MSKKIISILTTGILMASLLTGCSEHPEQLQAQCDELHDEIASLEAEKAELEDMVTNEKVDKDVAKYVVTFNIKQSHLTLDISEHIKDSMNDISIEIPVDKEYYNSVEIGDTIDDSFRVGSLIMKGSFGGWNITVSNKEIK